MSDGRLIEGELREFRRAWEFFRLRLSQQGPEKKREIQRELGQTLCEVAEEVRQGHDQPSMLIQIEPGKAPAVWVKGITR